MCYPLCMCEVRWLGPKRICSMSYSCQTVEGTTAVRRYVETARLITAYC